MNNSLSDDLIIDLIKFLNSNMGLHFPKNRWGELEKKISDLAEENGFQDAGDFIRQLLSESPAKSRIEHLASYLTVGETYFYREPRSFEVLKENILPEMIQDRRKTGKRLRIWSAGCCTGEEPYSIAVLLTRLIPDVKDWNITILATDINPSFLKKAREGIYSKWSFRNTPKWVIKNYFERIDENHFRVAERIKNMVTFSYLNLADDVYPALMNYTNAMDAIFCRNVLMYFTPKSVKSVAGSFFHSLIDGGWLIVSPAETMLLKSSRFVTVNFPEITLYKKDLYKHIVEQKREWNIKETDSLPAKHPAKTIPDLQSVDYISKPAPPGQKPPMKRIPSKRKARIEKTVMSKPARHEEALTLYHQGSYDEAEEKLLSLLSTNNQDYNAYPLLARVKANQGKLNDAIEWCEKAISRDKLKADLHYLRATILLEQDLPDEAMLSLKRALYLEPRFALAHFALGNILLRSGRVKETEKHFRNALKELSKHDREVILPESDGITAGRLSEIINAINV